MPVLAEDVYEDLDEAEDEDLEDALGGGLSERRGRSRTRGGGYNKPRIEKSFATQQQLQQVSERIAKDIRALDANVRSLEATARRNAGGMNQSMQMMMLLPLLTKKTVTTTSTSGGIPSGTRIVVDDGDVLTLMLPMLMMSTPGAPGAPGAAPSGYGQPQGGIGGMDPMMMMVMMMMLTDKKSGVSS